MKTLSGLLQVIASIVLLGLVLVVLVVVFQGMSGATPAAVMPTLVSTAQPYPYFYPPPSTPPTAGPTMPPQPTPIVIRPGQTEVPIPTWTPFPTFQIPTRTLRPGPSVTPLPRPTLAPDASGRITFIARENINVTSVVYSLDSETDAPPVASMTTGIPVDGLLYPSPDGSRAIVVGGWGALWVLNIETGHVEPLFRMGEALEGTFYAWHPDNRHVVVGAEGAEDRGLWLINVDSGEHTVLLVQVAPNEYGAGVSADGQRVVYSLKVAEPQPNIGLPPQVHNELRVVNVDGSNTQTILTIPYEPLAPLWSPDGSRIAFVTSGLMLINPDGSNLRQVSMNHGLDVYWPNFAWSPDGRYLAVIGPSTVPSENYPHSTLWYTGQFTGTAIYIVDVETGEERPLLRDDAGGNIDPVWSPDGQQIAFVSRRSGYPEIWAVNVDGTNLRQLTNLRQIVRYPKWHRP